MLFRSFRAAARAADYDRLMELCAKLDALDAAAGAEVRRHVESFDYDAVAKLFPDRPAV